MDMSRVRGREFWKLFCIGEGGGGGTNDLSGGDWVY